MIGETRVWWQNGVIYQIYPRSFQDSGADGVGDLKGIEARLDYLVDLGIDAVWVSPFYPSPMADFGYDVADYVGADPLFGTLADFDALLAGAHARGMKLILDFVPNHTSDQHAWFTESRSSRKSAKRDWYLWRDGAPGGAPPNNWMSHFGGPGWTLDEGTRQYFYHSFLKEQPDLNWRNPEVRAAMYGAMRFWLGRKVEGGGVDGFRMDVLWLLIKDDQFRSNPSNPEFRGGSSLWSVLPKYTADQPETHAIVREMRALLEEYGERVLIGEIYLPIGELMQYYEGGAGAQMPFNFHLIQTAWRAPDVARLIREYEAALPAGAWPNWVLGNHDQKRLATRIGAAQARVAAVLLLTLRGTPTLYYGDELGMPDARIAPEEVQDPAERNQPGIGQGRDPERSPMLWNGGAHAGFTAAEARPWLPLVAGWEELTVEKESADRSSMLHLYKRLLALRRGDAALHAGGISEVTGTGGVLSFVRTFRERRVGAYFNFGDAVERIVCPRGRVVLSSYLDDSADDTGDAMGGVRELRENEALVIELAD